MTEFINDRLKPDHVNNKYHNFLNTSSLDIQNYILHINNSTIGTLKNDKERSIGELIEKLFYLKFNPIKNQTETVKENEVIQIDLSKIGEQKKQNFQEGLNVVYSLINIVGIILQQQQVDIENYFIFDHFTEYQNAKRIFNYALWLDDNQRQAVNKFNQYLVYSTPIVFDMSINYRKLDMLIEEIKRLPFVDDNIDYEFNNIYTQNEHLVFEFVKNYDIKSVFEMYDLHFYNLIDAVTYDNSLVKNGGYINATNQLIKLNLNKINDTFVHKINENSNLILDNKQFIHLFDKKEHYHNEEYEVALNKIANILTRGFYDDDDGTKIFSDKDFANDVKNYLSQHDFINYENILADFSTQYEEIINKLELF